jgi:hypothetical protein
VKTRLRCTGTSCTNSNCRHNNSMNDAIHENAQAAKNACDQYIKAIYDLQLKHGVWEENEDSSCSTYTCARYYDETGKVKKYSQC